MGMRPTVVIATTIAIALTLPGVAVGQSSTRSPWATVNLCDLPSRPGAVGVRVRIPNRADAAQWTRIRLQFFDGTTRAWRLVRSGGDAGWTKLSDGGGPVTGGTTFTFPPPRAGARIVVRGLVDFEWRRGTTVVSRARVKTTSGHRNAADPMLRVSRASCQIVR